MGSRHFLPYEKIPKKSRVCMYGAGLIAKRYYEQNRVFGWCDICLVVDRNYALIKDFPFEVSSPESIKEYRGRFDYVLIAVHEKNAKKGILEFLDEIGIENNQIIDSTEEFLFKDDCDNIIELEDNVETSRIRLAWCISKAMGDQVISLKPYQALLDICPLISTDVFCNGSATARNIYYGQKCINSIKQEQTPMDVSKYDLVLEVGFSLILKAIRYSTIYHISPVMYSKMKNLHIFQKNKSADTGVYPYTSRIIMDRAKFLGKNRYTMLAEPNLFNYEDKKCQIYFDNKYEENYKALGLSKKYLTFNCEAGPAPGTGLKQLKEWPREYYTELLLLIKKEYPDIQLVQLGGKSTERIELADKHILGESLELVKYILKGSALHIDCESGLPHLATQLGVKCCVLFGPTPIWFIGYENNINIKSDICYGCKGLVSDWYSNCFKYDEAKCMKSIKPKIVFDSIREYLRTLRE